MHSTHPTVHIPQWTLSDSHSPPSDPTDIFSSDEFRILDFKVRRCPRIRPHDWTDCPYVHSGEKARRRDPIKFHYSPNPCPEFKKGNCMKGDNCEFAHGVFECWLHPESYRTQPCKDGIACRRKVCFFAHTIEQLRVVSPRLKAAMVTMRSSPTSVMSPPESPEGLVVIMGRMEINGGGLGLGFEGDDDDDDDDDDEGYDGLDVGWISELVK